jgi:hypothetical protein
VERPTKSMFDLLLQPDMVDAMRKERLGYRCTEARKSYRGEKGKGRGWEYHEAKMGRKEGVVGEKRCHDGEKERASHENFTCGEKESEVDKGERVKIVRTHTFWYRWPVKLPCYGVLSRGGRYLLA